MEHALDVIFSYVVICWIIVFALGIVRFFKYLGNLLDDEETNDD